MLSKARKLLLSTSFVLVLLVMVTGPAFASGHPGSDQKGVSKTSSHVNVQHVKPSLALVPMTNYPYDGSNPASTGCSGNAFSPRQWSDSNILVELRYSNTCYTAWARSTTSAEIEYTLSATRINDNKTESFSYDWGGAYTDQLYDLGSLHTKACVTYYFTFFPPSTGGGCTATW